MFSNESHFFVQGQRSQHVCRLKGKSVTRENIEQDLKHFEKRCFEVAFYISVSISFALLQIRCDRSNISKI